MRLNAIERAGHEASPLATRISGAFQQQSFCFKQDLGREPTTEELAEEMGMSLEKVQELLRASQEPLSLDQSINEDQDLCDVVGDQTAIAPPEEACHHLLTQQV